MGFRRLPRNGRVARRPAAPSLPEAWVIALAVTAGIVTCGWCDWTAAQEPTLAAPLPLSGARAAAVRPGVRPNLTSTRAPDDGAIRPVAAIDPRDSEQAVSRPAAPPPGGLTLDEIIRLCLLHDPKIRAGVEGIRQSQADWRTASLRPNPELSVAGALLPLSRPFTVDAPGGPSELDVGASYPIDWFLFGKRAAAMASACMGVGVSEAEYADLVRQRVLEAALGFYDVLEAKALLEVASQNAKNLERMAGVTQVAVQNGGRPQVELNRIRLDLLGAQRTVREAELGVVTAKANLRALLGAGVADQGFDVSGALDAPLTVKPLALEEAYEAATQQRPDVLALRRRVARAQADVVTECRNALPEVKSDWGLGHQYQRPIGAPDVTVWGTGLTFSVPFFNRNQGNRAKAASVVRQSDHALQAGLLELRAEVVQAVESLRVAHENATAIAQEALQLAAEVRDSINKAYAAGGRPLIDVLDAQRNYRETYQSYVTARADYWRAVYRYEATLGQQAER